MKKGRGCAAGGGGGGDSFLKEIIMSVWTASRSSAGLRVFNHGCRSWQASVNLSTSESILGSLDGTPTEGQGQPQLPPEGKKELLRNTRMCPYQPLVLVAR